MTTAPGTCNCFRAFPNTKGTVSIMENNFLYLGEDLGMGANKLFGAAGGLQVLSQAATSTGQRLGNAVGLRQRTRPLEIKTQHGAFYIGDGAHDYGRPDRKSTRLNSSHGYI